MARKVEAKVRLDLARDVKGSKKGFCKHIDDQNEDLGKYGHIGAWDRGPEYTGTPCILYQED